MTMADLLGHVPRLREAADAIGQTFGLPAAAPATVAPH
jgi:hypothetical protein